MYESEVIKDYETVKEELINRWRKENLAKRKKFWWEVVMKSLRIVIFPFMLILRLYRWAYYIDN